MVVRPVQAPARQGSGRVGAVSVGVLAGVLYSLRFQGTTRVLVIVLAIAVGAGLLLALTLARRRTALADCDGALVVSGPLRERVLPTAAGFRIVLVEVLWGGASRRRSQLWMIVGPTGRVALALNLAAWDRQALEGLRDRLHLSLEIADAPLQPAELAKKWPGSVPWWAVHPVAATALAVIVFVALVLIS